MAPSRMAGRALVPAFAFTPSWLAWRFALTHQLLPVAIGLPLFTLLMGFGGDQWVADHLFRLEGAHSALRHPWLTRPVAHKGGKWLRTPAALAAPLPCFHHPRRGPDRAPRCARL